MWEASTYDADVRAALERDFMSGVDPFFLADHVTNFLVEAFGINTSSQSRSLLDRMGPDAIAGIPAVARLFQFIEHGLARFLIELDRRLAILATFEKMDAG